jgi:hypothetical protein
MQRGSPRAPPALSVLDNSDRTTTFSQKSGNCRAIFVKDALCAKSRGKNRFKNLRSVEPVHDNDQSAYACSRSWG